MRQVRKEEQRKHNQRGPHGAPYARVGLSKIVRREPPDRRAGSALEVRFPKDAGDLAAMLAAGYRS